MKTKIGKSKLRDLILDGISTEELNSKYDYSEVIDMSRMFNCCTSLKTIPYLDTSNVKDMWAMFRHCSSLKTIPHFNTSNVTNTAYMFSDCTSLNYVPCLDISNVECIDNMFFNCVSLEHLPIKDSRINFNEIGSIKLFQNQPEDFL